MSTIRNILDASTFEIHRAQSIHLVKFFIAPELYLDDENGVLDSNVGVPSQRIEDNTFESNLEDFYAICDQIEANLKCALEVR